MFESQKSTGTGYTRTVALLAVAFIFVPAVLFMSRPFGYGFASLAGIVSALCAVWAWVNWKKASRLTIPSIASQRVATK